MLLADFSPYLHAPQRLPLPHLPHGGRRRRRRCSSSSCSARASSRLRLKQGKGQPIRDDGPQIAFITKKGTPTMGGLMILLGSSSPPCSGPISRNAYRLDRARSSPPAFAAVGFYDDYPKVTKQSHKGFSGPVAPCHRGGDRARRHLRSPCIVTPGAALHLARRSLLQGRADPARSRSSRSSRLRHRRRRQRREPHRRARRARHRAGDDRGGDLRPHRLSRRQRDLRRLSADPPRAGRGRAGGVLRRLGRRGARLPLVQRAAGPDLHGRHRLACARRRARRHRGRRPSTRSCSPSSAACSCSRPCR